MNEELNKAGSMSPEEKASVLRSLDLLMTSLVDYGNEFRPMILADYEAYESACRTLGREPKPREFYTNRVSGSTGSIELEISDEYASGNAVRSLYYDKDKDFWCVEWENDLRHRSGRLSFGLGLGEEYANDRLLEIRQLVRRQERERRWFEKLQSRARNAKPYETLD